MNVFYYKERNKYINIPNILEENITIDISDFFYRIIEVILHKLKRNEEEYIAKHTVYLENCGRQINVEIHLGSENRSVYGFGFSMYGSTL